MRTCSDASSRRHFIATTSALLFSGCVASELDEEDDPGPSDGDRHSWSDVIDAERDGTAPRGNDSADSRDEPGTNPPLQGVFLDRGAPMEVLDDPATWNTGTGRISADREHVFEGEHALAYDGPSGSITRTFTDPLDLSDVDLSIAAYFRHSTASAEPFFLIADAPTEADRFVWRAYYAPNTDWQRHDLAPFDARGEPDPSDVRRLEVRGAHPSGASTRFTLDDLRIHPKPTRGKVIFLFDGSRPIHYEEYRPLLAEFDYPAIEAVHADQVWEDHGARLSESQLRTLHAEGWDICPTTVENPWDLSAEGFRSHIDEMRQWLHDRRIVRGTNLFAYPYGTPTGRHLDVLGQEADLAFAGHGACSNVGMTNPLTLPRFDVENGLSVAMEIIERAATHRSLAVLGLRDGLTPAEFGELVRAVADRDDRLDVMTGSGLAELAWSTDRPTETEEP